jgi:hypothetical protein
MKVWNGSDATEVGRDDGSIVGTILMVGKFVGFRVGETVGPVDGFRVGESEGPGVGSCVGDTEGGCVVGTNEMEGDSEGGLVEGIEEGTSEGEPDSIALGPGEGAGLLVGKLETEGMADGAFAGDAVGDNVDLLQRQSTRNSRRTQ